MVMDNIIPVTDPGILEGEGVQGPRKGRSVGIFKLTSKKLLGVLTPLPPPPPLDPPLHTVDLLLECGAIATLSITEPSLYPTYQTLSAEKGHKTAVGK